MATKKYTAGETAVAIQANGYELSKPLQMMNMAQVLKAHIVGQQLYTKISSKNYAHVEGWQFAGGLLGLFPRVVRVEDMSKDGKPKWFAEVEIVDRKTGIIVSRGFALCSKAESKKSNFDEYAILSMAQTRAIGKAYRNVVGYVMKLAGYESTPAEEMTRAGEETKNEAQPDIVEVATRMILACKNGANLREMDAKIQSSKKYTKEQKAELHKLIGAQYDKLA